MATLCMIDEASASIITLQNDAVKLLILHQSIAVVTWGNFTWLNMKFPWGTQPRSQGLSLPAPKSERRETLVWSGHVRPKIWDVANKRLVGGADECEFCLYLV